MVSHEEVARAFMNGNKKTGSRMFTKEGVVYSYGTHFPISFKVSYDTYLFNKDKYSSSTSKHQSIVRRELASRNKEIIECDTREIKRAINNPEQPIIIENIQYSDNLSEILDMLKNYCKNRGMKRFPMKQWEQTIRDKLLMEQI